MSSPQTQTINADLVASQLQGWRLLGSSVWYCAGSYASLWIWTLVRHPSLWVLPWRLLAFTARPVTLACLTGASLPFALAALSLQSVLQVHEPQPNYTLRFRLRAPLGPTLALARLAARTATAPAITAAALCTALHAVSGLVFAVFDARLALGRFANAGELVFLGGLAASYALGFVLWMMATGQDALVFPILQRHRYFRLKQAVPTMAPQALQVFGIGTAIAVLQSLLLPVPGAEPHSLLSAALSMLCLCFCWVYGLHVVQVVATERISLLARDANAPAILLECLQPHTKPLLRSLALWELRDVARAPGMRSLRRQFVFGDETGEAWSQVGIRCCGLVRDAVNAAVGATAAAAPKAANGGGAQGHAARWNTVPLSVKAVGGGLTCLQAANLWWLGSHSHDVRLAVESLAALVAASRREDTYGALRLTQPSLGSVVAALAALQLALQQLLRWSYSVPDRQLLLGLGAARADRLAQGLLSGQAVDPHALALHDAVSQALRGACSALGRGVVDAVQDDPGVLLYGSVAEVVGAVKAALGVER